MDRDRILTIIYGTGTAAAAIVSITAYWGRLPAMADLFGFALASALGLAGPALMVAAAVMRLREVESWAVRAVAGAGLFVTVLAASLYVAADELPFDLFGVVTFNQDTLLIAGPLITYALGFLAVGSLEAEPIDNPAAIVPWFVGGTLLTAWAVVRTFYDLAEQHGPPGALAMLLAGPAVLLLGLLAQSLAEEGHVHGKLSFVLYMLGGLLTVVMLSYADTLV
ncbi:hypothetical protein AB0I81_57370 [Nonomuraea sp. NPDC050404]|uniref:hypothetical protein n=1 Tax=Nonomuraea sp. NPDC050404 TaxID=3155783 RepID=UPI003405478A